MRQHGKRLRRVPTMRRMTRGGQMRVRGCAVPRARLVPSSHDRLNGILQFFIIPLEVCVEFEQRVAVSSQTAAARLLVGDLLHRDIKVTRSLIHLRFQTFYVAACCFDEQLVSITLRTAHRSTPLVCAVVAVACTVCRITTVTRSRRYTLHTLRRR